MCLGRLLPLLQTGLISLGDKRLLEGRILRPPDSMNLADSTEPLLAGRHLIQPQCVSNTLTVSVQTPITAVSMWGNVNYFYICLSWRWLSDNFHASYSFFPWVFCKPTGTPKLDASDWFFCGLSLLQTSGLLPREEARLSGYALSLSWLNFIILLVEQPQQLC